MESATGKFWKDNAEIPIDLSPTPLCTIYQHILGESEIFWYPGTKRHHSEINTEGLV